MQASKRYYNIDDRQQSYNKASNFHKNDISEELINLRQALLSTGCLEEKIQYITDETLRIFGVDGCYIWLVKPGDDCENCQSISGDENNKCKGQGSQCLHLMAGATKLPRSHELFKRIPLNENSVGDSGAGKSPCFISNGITENLEWRDCSSRFNDSIKAMATYRITGSSSNTVGVFGVFNSEEIANKQKRLLKGLARSVAQLVQVESTIPFPFIPDNKFRITGYSKLPESAEPLCGNEGIENKSINIESLAEEKYLSVFLSAPVPISISSFRSGQFIEANDCFFKTFGYRRNKVIGATAIELGLITPEGYAKVIKNLENDDSVQQVSCKISSGKHKELILHCSINLLEIGEEEVLISTYHDITEAPHNNLELNAHVKRLDTIFNSTPSILALVNEDGCIEKLNRAALSFTGKDELEVIGKLAGEVFNCKHIFTGDGTCGEKEPCQDCPIRLQVEKTFQIEEERIESEGQMIFMRDGELKKTDFLISTVPLSTQGNDKVLLSLTDITEVKKAQEEKALLKTQLLQSQKLESIGRLAGGVAHDLNNLLSPILGYADILLDTLVQGDPMVRPVENIIYASKRAEDLVRQLLAFSRKQDLEFKITDVNSLLTNFEKLLRRAIREDITIGKDLLESAASVKVDQGQIEQVLMNLAVNAQDAMPTGGSLIFKTRQIVISNEYSPSENMKQGAYIVLSIIDTGCGMDEETKKWIFEPFYTTKSIHEGTGLGLATVYGIIKQHNGYIWVDSKLGQGTTFEIYLPAIDSCNKSISPVPVDEIEKTSKVRCSETILLVEDDELLRELAHDFLQSKGYKVISAGDGPDAIQRAMEAKVDIDLLLTDVIMPSMSGKELGEIIARMFPEVKTLFMSGHTDEIIQKQGGLRGENNLLCKPFSLKILNNTIRQILQPLTYN